MQTVPIETAQNVTIDYEIAGVGERILAYFIDAIIIIAYAIAVVIGYFAAQKYVALLKEWAVLYFALLMLPLPFYDLICETTMDGQSFAKKLVGIKVVKLDGTQPSVGSYLLRWVLRLVDIGFFSGAVAVITILINGKGQRLGDIAAGTTVIRLGQRVKMSDTILVRLDESYTPVFEEAGKLDERTVTIVKEVLDFEDKNRKAKSAKEIMKKTKARLEELMGVTSGMDPKEFLEKVLSDYNYYQQKR
ncbi:MAG: hypothetical protein A2176_04940 [Spirochaetes bacterium RBG_13_51_14]|nr:MAG: hypothetical protein A2176_04940 [Spirochaetes bacterium RBG_13_51_14]